MGQKYAAFDGQGTITAFYDDQDSPVPSGLPNVIAISDAEWQTCLAQPGQWTVVNGALVHTTPRAYVALDPIDRTFGGDVWQSSIA
ncbi:hypothetical protein B0G84_5753 [Paraburkholderia sp. BL8N3]|nr:hypothetical protein [Paraburkholderia sp. BL8N3]TCK36740.1 hypothetical protein B0G84_5753 [Paraburkholderia sp. BL8N3]